MKKSLKILLFKAFIAAVVSGQDLASGLVGRYPLDGNGQDISSQNNSLVMYNVQAASDRTGNPNGAVYLNGTTSWMVTTNDSPIFGSQPRTISVWFKSDDFGFYRGNPVLVGFGSKSGTGTMFDLFLGAAGQNAQNWSSGVSAFPFLDASNLATEASIYTINSIAWIHLVLTSGSTQSSTKIYINGVLQSLASGRYLPAANGNAVYSTNRGKMRVSTGSSSSGPVNDSSIWWNQGFKGSMDDIRIYNRQLSDSEVAALYQQSSTADSPPAISSQPSGQTLLAGQSIQLSVTASGSSPLSYQWLKSGAVIAGATAATYSVTGVTTSDSGSYSVVVSNAYGAVYSSSATVTVAQPAAPVITTQPRSVSATSGSTVSFTVEASGTPSPSYQWLKDGAPVAGATTRTLIFLSVSSANSGTYAVAASNSQGTVVSSGATLTVTAPVSAPAFTSQPASQTASAGSSVVLTAGAVGSPQPAYQWLKNGAVIVGATNAALILPSVSSSDAGNYYVIATNTAGAATSASATLAVTPASALSNLSVRTTLSSGQTLIVGGVVSGGSKPILVRAAGPALNKFGLVGMFDPRLELYAGQVPVGSNDNWQSTLATTFSRVGAFAFDVGSLDAAFSQSLNGAFTVQAKGTGPGALLVEAYDTGGGVAPRMVNISARNFVGTGADILIAGFALSGTGTKQLLIRAVGPTLAAFGVPNALTDPKVAVLTGAGAIITENDNWEAALAATFSQVGAFPLSIGSRDAALLVTLSAGASFTVQVSGVNGTTGEALIEIYEVF
jgi:hypothetical protein